MNVTGGQGPNNSFSIKESSSSSSTSASQNPEKQKWYSRLVKYVPFVKPKVLPKQVVSPIEDKRQEDKGKEISPRFSAEHEIAVDESLVRAITPHFNFSESVESKVVEVEDQHLESSEEEQPLELNKTDDDCWEIIQNNLHHLPQKQFFLLQRNGKVLSVSSIILKTVSKLKPNLDELFKDNHPIKLAEEKIVTLDGFTRFFLMMHSPVFKAMWTNSFQEGNPDHMTDLSHLTQEHFQKLLEDLCYKPSGISDNTLELLNLSNEWGISLLEKKYQNDLNHFIKGLSLETESLEQVINILNFAKDRNLKDVVESAQDYLDSYIYQIKDQKEFTQFLKHLEERELISDVTISLPAVADLSWLDIISNSPIKKLSLANRRDVTNECLKHLPAELTELNLFKCMYLTDEGLKVLPRGLIGLNMSQCSNITIEGIKFLPSNLRFLNLSSCEQITNDCIKQLQIRCKHLQSLNISNCKALTDDIYDFFPASLVELNLAFCSLSDRALSHLPSLLKSLNISNCSNMKGASFQKLPRALEKLNAGWCQLENSGLKHLPPQLKELILTACSEISTEGLKELPSSIESLNIADCDKIADEDLQLICARLSSLRYLDLSNCFFTDKGLRDLPPSLISLNLSSCSNLTSAILPFIPTSVCYLNLSYCENVSDEWLVALHNFLALEELELANCKKLTVNGLKYLPPSLLKLDLSGFINLNLDCFQCLPPLLQSLNVISCTGITKEFLSFLPNLLSLNISSNRDLSDEWLGHLPNHLQELIMNNCPRITNDGIPLLPVSLRLLSLSKTAITDKGLSDLPPFLRTLIIIQCKLTKKAIEALPSSLKIISDLT